MQRIYGPRRVIAGWRTYSIGQFGPRDFLSDILYEARQSVAMRIAPWLRTWGDQTGDPWSDCVCNDVRYELGHMDSCPRYGDTPDRRREQITPAEFAAKAQEWTR